jgi:hypothetical protein
MSKQNPWNVPTLTFDVEMDRVKVRVKVGVKVRV